MTAYDAERLSGTERHAQNTALNLLSRREHSRYELSAKLQCKGFAPKTIQSALDTLSQQGWQSDKRFCETFVEQRFNQGYGPYKISADLRQRGVNQALIDQSLKPYHQHWHESLARSFYKRFGDTTLDSNGKNRCFRYLKQRGFSADLIKLWLSDRAD